MPRALDHFVLATTDLDALGDRFAALGFSVGGVNIHPFGTKNRIIQLADQTFIELVGVDDPGKIIPLKAGETGFAGFVLGAASRRPGMAMLVLKSEDAAADARAFKAANIGDFAPFHFSRKGVGPDGTEREVAFTLAFAHAPAMPDCGFFTCQQHFPQNFWAPERQIHTNGVKGVRRVTLVAENPSDHHIFLGAFIGNRVMRSTSFGVEIEAGQSCIEIISPEGFAYRYGVEAPEAETPVFAGLEFHSPKQPLPAGGINHGGGVTFAPQQGFATALRFVPETVSAR